MEKTITGNDLLRIQDALEELFESGVKITLSESMPICALKLHIDACVKDFIDGIAKVIPSIMTPGVVLSESEQNIYDIIMMSPITIDTKDAHFGFLTLGDIAMLSNQTIQVLLQFF